MSVYESIRLNRRVIWCGIILGYVVAAALVAIRVLNAENTAGEVLGSVALGGAAAVAPTLALLSLDRRPGLLPAASLAAAVMGVVDLTLLPIWLLLALIWVWAHNRRPVKVEVTRLLWWARAAMAFGVVFSVFVLFVHLDPYCTQTMADGTVVQVDPAGQGTRSGWRFGSTTSDGFSTGQSGFDGPVSTLCDSDTIVWAEAVASLVINLIVIGAALRWPVNSVSAEPASRATAPPNVR